MCGIKDSVKDNSSVKCVDCREVSGNFRVRDNGDIEILIPSGYSVRFEKLVSGALEYIIFERS